jgi:hypothetical protein
VALAFLAFRVDLRQTNNGSEFQARVVAGTFSIVASGASTSSWQRSG